MDAPALLILCRTSVTIPVCSDWAFDIREGEQCWSSGESASLPPMCPGFDSRTTWRHVLVEFVVGSLLWSKRFFSERVLRFYPLLKNQHFQIPRHGHFWTSGCQFLDIPWVNKLHMQVFYIKEEEDKETNKKNHLNKGKQPGKLA